jgi:hypothetical protein
VQNDDSSSKKEKTFWEQNLADIADKLYALLGFAIIGVVLLFVGRHLLHRYEDKIYQVLEKFCVFIKPFTNNEMVNDIAHHADTMANPTIDFERIFSR